MSNENFQPEHNVVGNSPLNPHPPRFQVRPSARPGGYYWEAFDTQNPRKVMGAPTLDQARAQARADELNAKTAKKRRGWLPYAIGAGAFLLGLIVGAAPSDNSATDASPQPAVTVTLPNTGPSPDPVTTPTNVPEPPKYVTPAAKDFKLVVKTLRKQCFGSAGCNVTYRLSVDYVGKDIDPSKTYQVTYEVRGLEDGAAINTFTVQGDDITGAAEETGSTTSSRAKLTAVATGVLEG